MLGTQISNTRIDNLPDIRHVIITMPLHQQTLGTFIRTKSRDLFGEVDREVDAGVDGLSQFFTCAGEVGASAEIDLWWLVVLVSRIVERVFGGRGSGGIEDLLLPVCFVGEDGLVWLARQ
jgi:hypothetical protein